MSTIDQYKHKFIGFIECPSTSDFVYNNPTRKVAIYELLENIPSDEKDFDGKIGDLIFGGGKGEAPAFRISIPQAMNFFLDEDRDNFQSQIDLFKMFWTPTQSFIYCEGFAKMGWKSDSPIEFWLAENICLLLTQDEKKYLKYKKGALSKSVFEFI